MPPRGIVAPLGERGIKEAQTEIAAANDAAVPAAAKPAIALLGREPSASQCGGGPSTPHCYTSTRPTRSVGGWPGSSPLGVLDQFRQMARNSARDPNPLPVTLFTPNEEAGPLARYRYMAVPRVVVMLMSEPADKILPIPAATSPATAGGHRPRGQIPV